MTPPPLPEHLRWTDLVKAEGPAYTADQMIAYATAAMLAERARCLEWCRKVLQYHDEGELKAEADGDDDTAKFRRGLSCGAEDCIEAISMDGDWPGGPP